MTPSTDDTLVTGTIQFDSSPPDLTGSLVRVRLEDVSRADAPSDVVAESVIERPAERLSGSALEFTLSGQRSEIESRARYTVSVHVDTNSSGDVDAGDYVTTKAYPVLTRGNPDSVAVSVERVD